MVDFLANEDEYWRRTVTDPTLWSQKKAQHAKAQQKQLCKRQTLKHYVPRGNPNLASQSIPVTNDLLYEEEGITTTNDDDDDVVDLTGITDSTPLTPSTHISPPSSTTKPAKRASSVAPEDLCPKCKNHKVNTDCTNHICKRCCVQISAYCKVTSHEQSKVLVRGRDMCPHYHHHPLLWHHHHHHHPTQSSQKEDCM
jgi:hypothetical protein